FAAGIVALATGIMWGARSNVSFALDIIALKALPVLILGGFTSIPGAIVRGVIIGVGEKLGEFYWGPLLGSGIESWLAYVIALLVLLYRPQGLFGERIIEKIYRCRIAIISGVIRAECEAREPGPTYHWSARSESGRDGSRLG